jgi:hypothetical protein
VFDELPDKQDGFVTIDLSDDNNDSKKPNGGGINIVVKNFEASKHIIRIYKCVSGSDTFRYRLNKIFSPNVTF